MKISWMAHAAHGRFAGSRALTGGAVEISVSERGVELKVAPADRDPVDTIIALTLDRPVGAPPPKTPKPAAAPKAAEKR